MKNTRTYETLNPMIHAVLSVTLEEAVPELRPLAVALYLSRGKEAIRIQRTYPKKHIIHEAVKAALAFHTDEALFKTYADDGFFAEQIELLLETAKKNRLAGARLMPVFCSALAQAEDLNLSEDLQMDIIKHIEWQRNEDGFAIRAIDAGLVDVVPADDVDPA